MSDHCKSCVLDWDDLEGITSEKEFQKGRAAVVLCEGCGPTQVDPDGYCLGGGCWEPHTCISCKMGICPFHHPSLWRRLANNIHYLKFKVKRFYEKE